MGKKSHCSLLNSLTINLTILPLNQSRHCDCALWIIVCHLAATACAQEGTLARRTLTQMHPIPTTALGNKWDCIGRFLGERALGSVSAQCNKPWPSRCEPDTFQVNNNIIRLCVSLYRLVGLVVKVSASREEDLGFDRIFQVESYQWLKNWHSSGYPARRLAL